MKKIKRMYKERVARHSISFFHTKPDQPEVISLLWAGHNRENRDDNSKWNTTTSIQRKL